MVDKVDASEEMGVLGIGIMDIGKRLLVSYSCVVTCIGYE